MANKTTTRNTYAFKAVISGRKKIYKGLDLRYKN